MTPGGTQMDKNQNRGAWKQPLIEIYGTNLNIFCKLQVYYIRKMNMLRTIPATAVPTNDHFSFLIFTACPSIMV